MKLPTTNNNHPLLMRGAVAIEAIGGQAAFYDERNLMMVDAASGVARHLVLGGAEPRGTLHTDVVRETTDDE